MDEGGTEGPGESSDPAEQEPTSVVGEPTPASEETASDEPTSEAAAAPAPASSPSRPGLIVTAAVVLVALVGGAVWFFFLRGTSFPNTYGPTDEVPYSIGYPEGWKAIDDGGGSVTIAPFDLSNEAGLQRIKDHPEQFQAVAVSGVDSADNYDVSGIETSGGKLISDTQVQVGGRDARQIEATLPSSAGIPNTRILFFLVDLSDGKVLAIGFLSSQEGYDAGLFHDMADSVEIDEARLQAAIDAYQVPAPFPTAPPTANVPTAVPTSPTA